VSLLFIRCLSSSVVLLHLYRRTFVDHCFFVIVASAVVAPPSSTVAACLLPHLHHFFIATLSFCICHISSAAAIIHIILLLSLIHCCAFVDCYFSVDGGAILPSAVDAGEDR
jgi:hypothetical protein